MISFGRKNSTALFEFLEHEDETQITPKKISKTQIDQVILFFTNFNLLYFLAKGNI